MIATYSLRGQIVTIEFGAYPSEQVHQGLKL